MKKNTFVRLFTYIRRYHYLLGLSILSAIISVLCTLIAPLIIGHAIDHMAGAHRVDLAAVIKALFLLVITYLGSNLFLWLLTFFTNRLSYKTVNQLRKLLFKKLNTLPLNFFDRNPHGDTISRFVNDVDIISDGMLQGFMVLLSGVVTIIGTIAFMLSINAVMTLVVLISAPMSVFVARFIASRSQQLFHEQAKQLGLLNGYAEEIIQGQKVVKAFNYESKAYENFKEINSKLYKSGFKSQFISSLSNPSTRIVINIAYAVIGIIGGIAAIDGKITVGNISSFLIYSTIFTKPFNDITNILTQMQSANASAQRVFNVLDLEPETPDSENSVELKDCAGHVQFNNVKFSYNPNQNLIENFSLDVPAGSSIAIVGHTGAGKTTLVNLLMRFYDINGGFITIDGTDIRKIKRDSLRNNFGMVLQDTWIFDGSIRDNIAYAKPDSSTQDIIKAAKSSGADSFIRKLEKGYDTVITGDGESISQGQKQLLTIARVMLANPPMLILDEATSSIDTNTEMHIQQAFSKMMAGRTSFVIAHRLSTVKNADLILVMDKGRIVESGKHEQLLSKGGVYALLYNSQFNAANSDDAG